MLHTPNDQVRHRYNRAAEIREFAKRTRNLETKASLHKIEDRWLRLAQSYQLAENISAFNEEVRRFLKTVARANPTRRQR